MGSVPVAPGLWNTGSMVVHGLWNTGSLVVAPRSLEHQLAGCAQALDHQLAVCGPWGSGTPAGWLCMGSGTPAHWLWPLGLWNTGSLLVTPRALEHQLNSCGAQALLLHDEQSLPRPGFELVHVFYIGRWTLYP